MKKFKLICSAIAALTMLALAGCDLEVPEDDLVDIIPGFIMKGTATVNEGVGDMSFYFYPMYGTWTVNATVDGTEKAAETVVAADAWWSGVHSTHYAMADGSTIEFKVTAASTSTVFTPFFEGNDGTNYISINPNDGNAWGAATFSNQAYVATDFTEGSTYVFTVTRNGSAYTYTLGEAE